ncbi:MAG: hypothetical protein KDD82_31050 [Planctomycetes bacterium]|nr:hypothetical protein [Planctomycetota bacterium]
MGNSGTNPPESEVGAIDPDEPQDAEGRVKRKRKKKTSRLLDSGRFLVKSGGKRLKDSSKFLVDGVRAALSAPAPLRDQVFDGWRAGHCELERVPLELDVLINRALGACTAACAANEVDALRQGEPVELPRIPLDGDRIEAVLQTLILLAMEACTRNMRVEVRLRRETGGVSVQISSPRMLELSPEEEETLDVVGEIVRAHGGEFDFERGQGTSFLLGLPTA